MKKAVTLSILLFITLSSCFNDGDDNLNNQFEPEIPVATNPITVGSQIYDNLQTYTSGQSTNATDCIQVIYPITINVFDESLEFINFATIEDNDEFFAFLAGIQPEFSISICYPIIYTNDVGEEIQIENNEDLGEKLQECIDIELEFYCTELLTAGECLWKVKNNPDGNNDYENAIFKVSSIGITTFEHDDRVIFGSWTVLASFNQLFFNIYLDDTSEVALMWNNNWYVTVIDENNMMLQDGDSEVFFIERECSASICPKYIFEQCEIVEDSDTSNFDLASYIDCFASNIDISNAIIAFFETEVDASNATNPIISPYSNITNPKYIFVRIEDNTTGEFYIIKILLAAISC